MARYRDTAKGQGLFMIIGWVMAKPFPRRVPANLWFEGTTSPTVWAGGNAQNKA